ncbi:leucine-rich repeat domain-containing protein [Nostoc sp. FACHB-892]|uniref:leucine-rich repeat domain-containing protein n=1 Tax=Nostoc sp. FACHB-892 TaxID=2692843 RepID=UPI00168900FC|nr:leucine-rich repeat domain-containing protein [Nostoc sp. FACHB-892]MBD2729636.1 leucine-rich repeat domain-containing protein [Nostoc sp. FACHB-892]
MKTSKRSPKISFDTIRYLILFGLLGGLFIHSFCKYGIMNQVIGFLLPKASAQVPFVSSNNGLIPDWSKMKFQDMIVSESGNVTYPTDRGNQTRTWQAGQSIGDFMELGDFEDANLNIEKLTLSTISQALAIDLDSLKLDDFGIIKTQTLSDLVKAIPELANQSANSVAPIADFLRQMGISTNQRIGNVANYYNLDNITLGNEIDLSKYKLTSIPGIENSSFDEFANWQDTLISDIPGLKDLSWNNFPNVPEPDLSFVGQVDLPLGDIEANRIRSISGSYQEGFNVPCNQNNCVHFEASGFGQTTGAQWISGKVQKVKGGYGILAVANGGLEPTGRHPFGKSFKQVVWDIDESSGSVNTAMFFRFCKTIPFVGRTCTPYFIGPVPFINYHEKDPVIFGSPSTVPD